MDALDAAVITGLIEAEAPGSAPVHVLQSIDSTNAEALRQAASSRSGAVWLAEEQTAGRGRRGRAWVSPAASNLYLSVLCLPEGDMRDLGGLSLAAGVVVAEVLGAFGLKTVNLKWPNDILLRDKKLGGILFEMQSLPDGQPAIVCGLGLNIRMPADAADGIDQQWTDLATEMEELPARNRCAADLIVALRAMLAGFADGGFSRYHSRWQLYDAIEGALVRVSSAQQSSEGRACGVAADGALIVQTAEGEQLFYGGEVSVRPVRLKERS